jgi:hypothetical protein
MDYVGLSGFSDPIDEYVFPKYACGQDLAPRGVARANGFDEIIEGIESLPASHRTDCAITLLDLSGTARFLSVLALPGAAAEC